MTLPLSNSTFWNAVKLSYALDTEHVDTIYAKDKTECYWNFVNKPMLSTMYNDIVMMQQNQYPRLVIHSAHDWTIIKLLLSLGMYDYKLVMFAEMVTMEIYSAKNNTDLYYFRFTRKGQFVPYPGCNYMNGDTQLCDLEKIINRTFQNIISNDDDYINRCENVITNCVCGYCGDDEGETSTTKFYTTSGIMNVTTTINNDDSKPCSERQKQARKDAQDTIDATGESFWVGVAIGIGFGMIIMIVAKIICKFACKKEQFPHDRYLLEDEEYKL